MSILSTSLMGMSSIRVPEKAMIRLGAKLRVIQSVERKIAIKQLRLPISVFPL